MRDPSYEHQFLENVQIECARRAGIEIEGFVSHVKRRIEWGAQRYGDEYLSPERDNVREITEETADAAVYAMLELQRIHVSNREDEEDSVPYYLFQATVHAAIADHFARQALATRRAG